MPGMYGGTASDLGVIRRLESEFRAVWTDAEIGQRNRFCFGGHTFGPHDAVRRCQDVVFTLDGDYGFYLNINIPDLLGPDQGQEDIPGILVDLPEFVVDGNLACVDPVRGRVTLQASPSGAYPLYYTLMGGGLLYSSHLRPLARAVEGKRDLLGICSFLEMGYIIGDRTFFEGIHRLRPGQILQWGEDDSARLHVTSRSRNWVGLDLNHEVGTRDCAGSKFEVIWSQLRSAMGEGLGDAGNWALMMSGGWDSRTLLAACPPDHSQPLGFCHGDLDSRELAIAGRVCDRAGVSKRQMEIDGAFLDPSLLNDLFAKVELTIFPYWYRSGQFLSGLGMDCVAAGVFGEVIGGHYGPAMLRSGWRKIATVARGLMGLGVESKQATRSDVTRIREVLLRGRGRSRPRALSPAIWKAVEHPGDALAAQIDDYVRWLLERGVSTPEKLVEAFVTEHRGAQYIHGQLRSARAALGVTAPFANPRLLNTGASLSLDSKIHNRINQTILRIRAPELLEAPLAATLARASRPIWFQELSRLLRKLREDGHWRLHRSTNGFIGPPRLAWINFEMLRETGALQRLAATLTSNIWSQDEIQELVDTFEGAEWPRSMHPVVHQLLKMHTVENMLR